MTENERKQIKDAIYFEFRVYLTNSDTQKEIKLNTRIETNVVFRDDFPQYLFDYRDTLKDGIIKSSEVIHDIARQFLLTFPHYRDGNYTVKEGDDSVITIIVDNISNYPDQYSTGYETPVIRKVPLGNHEYVVDEQADIMFTMSMYRACRTIIDNVNRFVDVITNDIPN